ncbi:hypothetical protein [Thermogymnomonas acidicola]|uniref:hypothetical protein n=1 Tax=Thermogymnomonas acidicola TaxID=399579 RepID=UPI0014941D94|nr:hypothetical protein [Thermogymnomonas acidicola]
MTIDFVNQYQQVNTQSNPAGGAFSVGVPVGGNYTIIVLKRGGSQRCPARST